MRRVVVAVLAACVVAGCGWLPPDYCELGQEWMFQCNYTLEKAGEEEIAGTFDRECELIPNPSARRAWEDRYSNLRYVDTSDLDECIEARDRMLAEWEPWE